MVPGFVLVAEILLLILISARVLTFLVSLFLTPGTLFKSVFGCLFGQSIVDECEISTARFSKTQRSQMNSFTSAILVCTCIITLALVPGHTSRKSGLSDAGSILNLTGGDSPVPVAIQPFVDWVGLSKAFGLIFIGECGDKTFFVAMILAMKYGKTPVFIGSMAALGLMTILAVAVGWVLVGMVRVSHPGLRPVQLNIHHVAGEQGTASVDRSHHFPRGRFLDALGRLQYDRRRICPRGPARLRQKRFTIQSPAHPPSGPLSAPCARLIRPRTEAAPLAGGVRGHREGGHGADTHPSLAKLRIVQPCVFAARRRRRRPVAIIASRRVPLHPSALCRVSSFCALGSPSPVH